MNIVFIAVRVLGFCESPNAMRFRLGMHAFYMYLNQYNVLVKSLFKRGYDQLLALFDKWPKLLLAPIKYGLFVKAVNRFIYHRSLLAS